jgi:hypothetical protein
MPCTRGESKFFYALLHEKDVFLSALFFYLCRLALPSRAFFPFPFANRSIMSYLKAASLYLGSSTAARRGMHSFYFFINDKDPACSVFCSKKYSAAKMIVT